MSEIVSFPVPKTIAFGGVATGSMNARLDARTNGIDIFIGAIERAIAIDAAIGRKVDVVAVLDVSSVRNIINVVMRRITSHGLRFIINANDSPNHWPNPELLIAAANDKPPPNKIKSPQGNFFASSQISSSVLLF